MSHVSNHEQAFLKEKMQMTKDKKTFSTYLFILIQYDKILCNLSQNGYYKTNVVNITEDMQHGQLYIINENGNQYLHYEIFYKNMRIKEPILPSSNK